MTNKIQATAALMITLVMASCGNNEEPKKTIAPVAATKSNTMTLQPRQISGSLQLPGVMQPLCSCFRKSVVL